MPNTPLSENMVLLRKMHHNCSWSQLITVLFHSWHHTLQQAEAVLSWLCLMPRSSFSLGLVPSEVLWLLRAIKAPLHYWHIVVIHHLSAGLLLYIMVLHQGNGRWQEPQTQRQITFLSFMGCFFSPRQQIKARKAVLNCCHEAFKTFKYIYLYIFPLTLKH